MIDFIMAAKQRTTIFKQLIMNVMVPPILALLLLGILNFTHTRNILVEERIARNYIIGDEIIKVLEFQDVALNLVESRLNERMELLSGDIQKYFKNTENIESFDLSLIQQRFGMNPIMEDIYIINRNGIVVNTTFEKDLNLNFFSFGEEHKNMLLNIFDAEHFHNERFAIEASTKRIKKFSYQPTLDGKYIIQIGVYSPEADEIIDFIRNTSAQIAEKNHSIEDVELFIGADNPFSLNKGAFIEENHKAVLDQAFQNKDTIFIDTIIDKRRLNYQFIYMDRKNTDLYKGSVIRIISDLTNDYNYLKTELFKFISIFSITLILVIILIYFKTKIITDPIKKLVLKVNRITHGHLNERAEVIGNNEITTLSKQFNLMIVPARFNNKKKKLLPNAMLLKTNAICWPTKTTALKMPIKKFRLKRNTLPTALCMHNASKMPFYHRDH